MTENKIPTSRISRWEMNSSTCNIPEQINNVSQTLSFNLNVANHLRDGAETIYEFKEGACKDHFAPFFLTFIELGRRCFVESRKMMDLWHKYQPSKPLPDNPMECYIEAVVGDPSKMNKAVPSQEIYTDLTFHVILRHIPLPEIDETVANGLPNVEANDEDDDQQEGESVNSDNENGDTATDGKQGKRKRKAANKPKKKKSVGKPEDRPQLNANWVWAQLLREIFYFNSGQASNKGTNFFSAGKSVSESLKNIQPHEYWKTLKETNLQKIYDFYTSTTTASASFEKYNQMSLTDTAHIFSAQTLFSKLTMAQSRSRECVDQQSPRSIQTKMFIQDTDTGNLAIRPTLRKYWLKVNPSEWSPENIFYRLLPWKQSDQVERLFASLPIIAEDHFRDQSNRLMSKFSDASPSSNNVDTTASLSVSNDFNEDALPTIAEQKTQEDVMALEQMMNELSLENVFNMSNSSPSSSANQYDPRSFEELSGKTLSSYLSEWFDYICVYSGMIQFGQRIKKALDSLQQSMNDASHPMHKRYRNPTVILYKMRKLAQMYLFKEFCEKARSETSDISPTGRAIYQFIKSSNIYGKAPQVKYAPIDRSLSCFANYDIKHYAYLEVLCFVAGTHRFHRLAAKYRLDAYRGDMGLHLCLITYEKSGGTGKSWMWDRVIQTSIPGTVKVESHRSTQAELVDSRYESDEIVIFHEIDKSLVDERFSHNPDRARLFKERLERQETTARRNEKDPLSGKRYTKESRTERISVFFGSSNEDLESILLPAMRSRIHLVSFEDNIYFKNISALGVMESILSSSDRSVAKSLEFESMLIQALFFDIEKMILCRIIANPSCHVASVMLMLIREHLTHQGVNKAIARDIVRTQILSRLHCIMNAIVTTFFFPGGKHYQKKIEPIMFLDIEPMLYVTVQDVVRAVGEQIDLYVDETEANVLRIIRSFYFQHPDKIQYKTNYNTHGTSSSNHSSSNNTFNKKSGGGSNRFGNNNNGFHSGDGITDPTYIRFPKSNSNNPNDVQSSGLRKTAELLHTYAKKTSTAYSNNEKEKARLAKSGIDVLDAFEIPSEFSIIRVLKSWTTRTIMAMFYQADAQQIGGVRAKWDVPPQPQEVAINTEQWSYYLHYEFVMGRIPMPEHLKRNALNEIRRTSTASWKPQHHNEDSNGMNYSDQHNAGPSITTLSNSNSNNDQNEASAFHSMIPHSPRGGDSIDTNSRRTVANWSQRMNEIDLTNQDYEMNIDEEDINGYQQHRLLSSPTSSMTELPVMQTAQMVGGRLLPQFEQVMSSDAVIKNSKVFGRHAVKNAIVSILTKKKQLPMRLIFDIDNRTGHISNIIEVTQDQIDKGEPLLIPSPIRMDKMCELLLSDKQGLDDMRKAELILINTDLNSYGLAERNKLLYITRDIINPSYKEIDFFSRVVQGDEEDEEDEEEEEDDKKVQFDVTTTPMDHVANSQQDVFDKFDDQTTPQQQRLRPTSPSAKKKKTKIRKTQERSYLATDEDYEENGCYFLGRPIRRTFNIDEMVKNTDIRKRLERIMDELDQPSLEDIEKEVAYIQEIGGYENDTRPLFDVDQQQLETMEMAKLWIEEKSNPEAIKDEGLCHRDYVMPKDSLPSDYTGTDRLYHWQMDNIPDGLRDNPREYKMIQYHPLMHDWFANHGKYNEKNFRCYPGDALDQHQKQKARQFELFKRCSSSDMALQTAMKDLLVYCSDMNIVTNKETNQVTFVPVRNEGFLMASVSKAQQLLFKQSNLPTIQAAPSLLAIGAATNTTTTTGASSSANHSSSSRQPLLLRGLDSSGGASSREEDEDMLSLDDDAPSSIAKRDASKKNSIVDESSLFSNSYHAPSTPPPSSIPRVPTPQRQQQQQTPKSSFAGLINTRQASPQNQTSSTGVNSSLSPTIQKRKIAQNKVVQPSSTSTTTKTTISANGNAMAPIASIQNVSNANSDFIDEDLNNW